MRLPVPAFLLLLTACVGHHDNSPRVNWLVEVTPGEGKPAVVLPVEEWDYSAAIPYSRVVVGAEGPREARGGWRRVFTLSSVGEQKVRQEVACSTANAASGTVGGEATLTLEGASARFFCQL
jgi:hypothetical protein